MPLWLSKLLINT